jgi:hypothetical protein
LAVGGCMLISTGCSKTTSVQETVETTEAVADVEETEEAVEEVGEYDTLVDEGDALVFSGKWDEGIAKYEEAIKVDPLDTNAYSGIMWIYLEDSNIIKAKEVYDRYKAAAAEAGEDALDIWVNLDYDALAYFQGYFNSEYIFSHDTIQGYSSLLGFTPARRVYKIDSDSEYTVWTYIMYDLSNLAYPDASTELITPYGDDTFAYYAASNTIHLNADGKIERIVYNDSNLSDEDDEYMMEQTGDTEEVLEEAADPGDEEFLEEDREAYYELRASYDGNKVTWNVTGENGTRDITEVTYNDNGFAETFTNLEEQKVDDRIYYREDGQIEKVEYTLYDESYMMEFDENGRLTKRYKEDGTDVTTVTYDDGDQSSFEATTTRNGETTSMKAILNNGWITSAEYTVPEGTSKVENEYLDDYTVRSTYTSDFCDGLVRILHKNSIGKISEIKKKFDDGTWEKDLYKWDTYGRMRYALSTGTKLDENGEEQEFLETASYEFDEYGLVPRDTEEDTDKVLKEFGVGDDYRLTYEGIGLYKDGELIKEEEYDPDKMIEIIK